MSTLVSKRTKITSEDDKADSSQTLNYIIYLFLGLIEVLLVFRLVLKLTGANPESGFVNFIYGLSQILIVPFVDIFPQATTQGVTTTAVLEPATLVAIVVFAVFALGLMQVVKILSRRQQ
jgi:hypothetical protein